MTSAFNLLGYQAIWCAAVYGAANERWWLGLALLAPFALWQIARSRWPRADAALVLLAALIGFGVDSAFAASGWLRYASPLPDETLAPFWILAMWMAFALTLNHSLAFLKRHALAAIAIGALGGPLAYWVAGAKFGAVHISDPSWRVLLALGLAWAALVPLLARLAERLVLRFPAAQG
jgi:hypothetical protein